VLDEAVSKTVQFVMFQRTVSLPVIRAFARHPENLGSLHDMHANRVVGVFLTAPDGIDSVLKIRSTYVPGADIV
jgi:hypothetical protein